MQERGMLRDCVSHGRTKIPHVRREIDEKEGGKRVEAGRVFEHDQGRVEEMTRRGASCASKSKV